MYKWEAISMEFFVGLDLTSMKHNSILVVVYKLTKSTHFIPVRDTYDIIEVARVITNEIVCIHKINKKN